MTLARQGSPPRVSQCIDSLLLLLPTPVNKSVQLSNETKLTLRRCLRGTCPGHTIVMDLNEVFDGLPLMVQIKFGKLRVIYSQVEHVAKTALGSLKSSFGM